MPSSHFSMFATPFVNPISQSSRIRPMQLRTDLPYTASIGCIESVRRGGKQQTKTLPFAKISFTSAQMCASRLSQNSKTFLPACLLPIYLTNLEALRFITSRSIHAFGWKNTLTSLFQDVCSYARKYFPSMFFPLQIKSTWPLAVFGIAGVHVDVHSELPLAEIALPTASNLYLIIICHFECRVLAHDKRERYLVHTVAPFRWKATPLGREILTFFSLAARKDFMAKFTVKLIQRVNAFICGEALPTLAASKLDFRAFAEVHEPAIGRLELHYFSLLNHPARQGSAWIQGKCTMTHAVSSPCHGREQYYFSHFIWCETSECMSAWVPLILRHPLDKVGAHWVLPPCVDLTSQFLLFLYTIWVSSPHILLYTPWLSRFSARCNTSCTLSRYCSTWILSKESCGLENACFLSSFLFLLVRLLYLSALRSVLNVRGWEFGGRHRIAVSVLEFGK